MKYLTISKTGKRTPHKLNLENCIAFDFFGCGVDMYLKRGRPARYHCEYQFDNFGYKSNTTRYLDDENLSLVYQYAREKGLIKC
jgi:hypothetical protein